MLLPVPLWAPGIVLAAALLTNVMGNTIALKDGSQRVLVAAALMSHIVFKEQSQ